MMKIVLAVLCVTVMPAWADLEESESAEHPARDVAQRPTRQQQQPRTQPVQAPAQVMQQDDIFEQMRTLSGRLDVVENQLSQINAAHAGEKDGVNKEKQAIELKFVAYEDALKKLETQMQAMSEELNKMKLAQVSAPVKPEKAAKEKPEARNPNKAFEEGEALLKDKKYREAILAYEKYRGTNASGKFYADATYKMGVCFHEMGMKDEAKIFFDEVMTKFPKSPSAKKAAVRAKQLK